MAAHAFHVIVLAPLIHTTLHVKSHIYLTYRQLTYSHITVHTCYSSCVNANSIFSCTFTFTFLSALKFICFSFFNYFWVYLHFLLPFFLLPLISFFTSPSCGPLPALFEPAVSSLERSSPVPDGRSRSLRSTRGFGGSSVTVVKMTPLSFLPGTRIIKYLGIINMFFIRETTSLREVRLQGRTSHV